MGGSRTVKTLTVLLVAMTLGALALMMLETEPVRPAAQPLAVLSPPPAGPAQVIYETSVPLQRDAWRYVVIHAAGSSDAPAASQCHLRIEPDGKGGWKVDATPHWAKQQPSTHVTGFWQNASIGVCLIGDFSRQAPDREQFNLLVDLVNTLQEVCKIPADKVYLYSDLVSRSTSPGEAFPAAKFASRLLRPQK